MHNSLKRSKLCLGAVLTAAALVTGCGNSENFVFTQTSPTQPTQPILPVPAPPVAVNDFYNALGNATVTFSAANGVLANDTVNGATITAFDETGSQGGTVVLSADGSFAYTPEFGFVGQETFTYTLSNADGDSTATVTLTSTGQGFFVNNQAASGGDGSQAAPFDTLNPALAAAESGDTVFVYRGNGSAYPGGFNLPVGVSLIGEGNGLVVAQQIEPEGQEPEIGGFTLLGDNTVSGFLFTGAAAGVTASGADNLTVSNNIFRTDGAGRQTDFNNIGGTLSVVNNTFELDGNDEDSVVLVQNDTDATVTISDNSFGLLAAGGMDGEDAVDLNFTGNSVVTLNIERNIITGSGDTSTSMNIESGIELDSSDTTQLTIALNDNQMSRISDHPMNINIGGQSSFSLTATDNQLTDIVRSDAVLAVFQNSCTGTQTWSMNTVTNVQNDFSGFRLRTFDDASVTTVMTANTITSATSNGINLVAGSTSTDTVTLRDNNFSMNTFESILIQNSGMGSVCLDATGNTFDTDLFFNQFPPGVIGVEELANFNAVNTFLNMSTVTTSGTITDRPDGFCSSP